MKAIILAAGFGNRLRPFTEHTPKSLFYFGGRPLITRVVDRLRADGFSDFAINVHYLAAQMSEWAGQQTGTAIHVSLEAELLGTAGFLGPLTSWRQGEDVLVTNSDIVSDMSFASLWQAHLDLQAEVTLALLPKPHMGETVLWIEAGQLRQIGGPKPSPSATGHGFACAHVLSHPFISHIPAGRSEIFRHYQERLDRGLPIHTHIVQPRYWYDLGTPERVLAAHRHYASLGDDAELVLVPQGECMVVGGGSVRGPGFFVKDSLKMGPGTIVGPHVYISAPAVLGDQARLSHSVITAESSIAAQSCLDNVIIHGQMHRQMTCAEAPK